MDIVFTIHDPMWGNSVTLFCFYGVQALQTEIRLDGWLHFLFVYVKLADRVIRPEEVAPDTYEGKFIMCRNKYDDSENENDDPEEILCTQEWEDENREMMFPDGPTDDEYEW